MSVLPCDTRIAQIKKDAPDRLVLDFSVSFFYSVAIFPCRPPEGNGADHGGTSKNAQRPKRKKERDRKMRSEPASV